MSKRKINQQQQRRIAHKQASMLNTAELSGLVIANHGQIVEVESHAAENARTVIKCNKRQHLGPLVPGDIVKWQFDPNTQSGVVIAVEPRRSLLTRPDARGNLHAVGANVDQMFIIIAPKPAPSQTTVDRYLLAARAQNIAPILVINKEDLLNSEPHQQELLELIEVYKKIGVETIIVSAKKLQHLSLLHDRMQNKTSIFVGQSGVGKSSIIATLLPEVNIKTGELSTLSPHGRHTTTTARLYHVENLQAMIIDSPGMREFPLWKLDPATLAEGFVEFIPYLHECKFRNCTHNTEPGCALLNAAASGAISPLRLASYKKILVEMQEPPHY